MFFEVILRQLYDGKNVLNRWHYNGSGTPAAVQMSYALTKAFGGVPLSPFTAFDTDTVMHALYVAQALSLHYVELQVAALYDVSDFYVVPYAPTQMGGVGGTPMSAFAAYGLQSNRLRTDIHRGNKRICGVSETMVGDHGDLTGSIIADLADLADKMGETLEYDDEGNTLSFQPCVLSFEKHDPDADHDDFWYSRYPTQASQLAHAALGVSWTAKSKITTQNSRKR